LLVIMLLAAGCTRFTYDETPTPTSAPYVAPSPTSPPVAPTAAASATPVPTPTVAGPTVLHLEPSLVSLTVGETRPVQVLLDHVERLHSIELHIGFEPGYLQVEDANLDLDGVQVDEGVIPAPDQVVQNEVNNENGLIIYHVAQAPGTPVDGSGIVASFTVRALADGGSPLRFNVVKLVDPEEEPLPEPEQVIDGLVTISVGDDTPEPTSEAAVTETPSAATPVAVTPTPSPAPTVPSTTSGIYYTVRPGENLFRIALRYGTTADVIAAANDLPDQSSVQAGQTLLIPVSPANGTLAYVVQPGDWLWSIARRFDTTPEKLAALNGISPPYTIEPGQVLIIVP
jgi:LysM repeat protein